MKHFLEISRLSYVEATTLIERALYFKKEGIYPTFPQGIVANLFYENSTRTRVSFELAAGHLGMVLGHILVNTFPVEHIEGQPGNLPVRVEAEGKVDIAISFIRLLVEIDRPHTVLDLLEIRGDIDDIIDAPHIT